MIKSNWGKFFSLVLGNTRASSNYLPESKIPKLKS